MPNSSGALSDDVGRKRRTIQTRETTNNCVMTKDADAAHVDSGDGKIDEFSDEMFDGSNGIPRPADHEWPKAHSSFGFGALLHSYNQWSYSYMNRVLDIGARQLFDDGTRLTADDLYRIPSWMETTVLNDEFEKHYSSPASTEQSPRRKLISTLWQLLKPTFIPAGFCQLATVAAQLTFPLYVQEIITMLQDHPGESISRRGVVFALLVFASIAVNGLATHRQRHLATTGGVVLRSAVINAIYKHALALTPQGRSGLSTGEITNLVALDSQKLFEVTQEGHLLWSCPLQMTVVTTLLLLVIGWPAFVGMTLLFGLLPLAKQLASFILAFRQKRVEWSDKRVEIINAVLHGIKVTKLNNYEEKYLDRVNEARRKELYYLRRELAVWAASLVLTLTTPVVASAATFAAFVLVSEDNRLYASTTFTTVLLFSALRFPMSNTGRLIGKAAQALQATKRIAEFLERETRPYTFAKTTTVFDQYADQTSPVLVVKNGTFTCGDASLQDDGEDAVGKEKKANKKASSSSSSSPQLSPFSAHSQGKGFALSGIDLSLFPGTITAVVGSVGSGKSTLMNGLVGDVPSSDETLTDIRGKVAFASQIPFILNATLRDNILFGLPFDRERYDAVLDACCLHPDIEQLGGAGDLTEIGERGVTLSGGQKQRVSLARVAYSNPDVALFDDPLSALDAGTSRKVFDRLFKSSGNSLLSSCAIVLVTHASFLLRRVDEILVLTEGQVAFHGTWSEMLSFESTDTAKLSAVSSLRSSFQEDAEEELPNDSKRGSEHGKENTSEKQSPSMPKKQSVRALIKAEQREHGHPSLQTWLIWFKHAGGFTFFFILVLTLTLDKVAYVGTEWWLTRWAKAAEDPVEVFGNSFPAQTDGREAQYKYLRVYALLFLISVACTFARSEWAVNGGFQCARSVFQLMISRVLHAPMSYFETTPLGRILNRFTFDVEILDFTLVENMSIMLICASWFFAAIAVIVTILPWIVFSVLPVTMLYVCLHRYFRKSGADLQRLDAVSRSPLQAMLAEGIDGAATIRIFEQGATFLTRFQAALDRNSSALLNLISAQRWLSVRIESLGACVVLVASMLIVTLNDVTNLDPGLAAMLFVWSSNFTIQVQFLIDSIALTESSITSIERIRAVSQLEQEKSMVTSPSNRVPESWPSQGTIEFDNVCLRYRSGLPLALNNLSFRVEHGMRCGVVGRTGAGKSSISVGLFRLVEIESGQITLDGVDLSTLGLSDVRGRSNGMTIIPQDPVLFAGTLRECIDPFGGSPDGEVLDALLSVRLATSEMGFTVLDERVEEGGSNFSVGERQLLCLARAILAKPKLLVLDEATASVDGETDAFIQSMLRSRFKDTTLLTVAHRLDTIMDYDKVLVMSDGEAVEFGSPSELLQDANGVFTELVNATGEESAEALRALATRASQ